MQDTGLNEESNEAQILRARDNSNRAIARRNLLGVGDSLGEDYVGIIGDGTFVPSRAEYLRLFKEGFDHPKQSMTYVRTIRPSPPSMVAGSRRSFLVPSRIPAPMPRCGGERQRAGKSDQRSSSHFTTKRSAREFGT